MNYYSDPSGELVERARLVKRENVALPIDLLRLMVDLSEQVHDLAVQVEVLLEAVKP